MVTLRTEEIEGMQAKIDQGQLPKDAIKQHFEAEARNVFGHDAKKDRQGHYVEQGIGSRGHETANHFAALRKAEREGNELPGAYRAALEDIWKRDPKRAKSLGLPPVPKEVEPRPTKQAVA